MSTLALMLGDPNPPSFVGHLRLQLVGTGSSLAVAGRVAVEAGVIGAFLPARRVEAALREAVTPALDGRDRHLLLHRAWAALAAIPALDLGPAGGADLSLLLVAADDRGVGIAGVGMCGVWGEHDGQWRPLVGSGHPLLRGPGRPEKTPGVLTLTAAPTAVLAIPSHLPPELPAAGRVRACAGARP